MIKEEWKEEASKLLSTQLNNEFSSFYLYQALYSLCDSSKFAMPGLKCFFENQIKDEINHAKGVIQFMNKVDLSITFKNIELTTDLNSIKSPADFLNIALKNEEKEYEHILHMHNLASKNNDVAMCNFLDAYVDEQVSSLKDLRDFISVAQNNNVSAAHCMLECRFCKLKKN